jgi:hypothetical protein
MLTPAQIKICEAPGNAKILISGPAGCGKTSAAIERVLALIQSGIPADSILVLTPQRGLQNPYLNALMAQPFAGGQVTPATIGGLAQRMVDLFWPLAAEAAGFTRPDLPPVFLTLETAQYYMAHLVRPMLDQGYFDSVTINRNRLYSQILDNLNKAAIVGFPIDEIGSRLTNAWIGDPAQRRIYADAQECANRFRAYCLEHNLLDFSLQFEIFANLLWTDSTVRASLVGAYRHLIYDNLEEDGARAHDLIEEWLPEFDSALLISDSDGGFRQFLGADPTSAQRFESLVTEIIIFDESFVQTSAITNLEENLLAGLSKETQSAQPLELTTGRGFDFVTSRFYPELLDAIALEIQNLLADGQIQPGEIAVLSPYLSDALRFSLMNRLTAAGIPTRSHRPSRSLRDEPASQALLSLAALAHPAWDIHPARFDVTYALMLALDIDLVRGQLLTDITYRQRDLNFSGFEEIQTEMQERLTFSLGNRYTILRNWLNDYRLTPALPLDHFLRKLFGEVLSQPGFGFHTNLDSVRVAASLIESVKKFRQALQTNPTLSEIEPLGKEYIAMLAEGVLAAQYLHPYQPDQNAVLVAPATTFLMMNQPASIQFWLDAGASGWSERLSQPLTQSFVLSRNWTDGQPWTDPDEVRAETETLAHIISGLLRRCRQKIYLGLPELSETGFEQRGILLRLFQQVLQNA